MEFVIRTNRYRTGFIVVFDVTNRFRLMSDAMKPITFPDLRDRIRQTIEKKRQRLLCYDNNCEQTADFYGFEVFEFLIFLEVRNADGNAILHYPVAIGHETILEDSMREQLAIYSRLLPSYPVAVVAIESALANWEEWDLLFAYPTAEALVDAILDKLEEKLIESNKQTSDSFCCPKEKTAQEQTIEITRFLKDEDSEPLPLVISTKYHCQNKIIF